MIYQGTMFAGILLVILGIANVILMLESLGRKGGWDKFRILHRWTGRIFILIFIGMFALMLPRMQFFTNFPSYMLFHTLLAFALLPLVIGKYLLITRYKNYMGSAATLGVIVMIGTLLIVTSVGGAIISSVSH